MAKLHVFILVVIMALGVTLGITDQERNALKEVVKPILDSCRDKYDITREDALAAKKDGNIDALNPCFYACFFKKTGFITEAGLFDPDVALEKNKKYIKGEEDLKKIAEIAKTCTSVNEQAVTDGSEGCERSKRLLSCFIKEKATFSPFSSA